jgi:GTPase SAR1 family protein
MKRVLITGMSGTGKSSLLHELAARGYRTVDTDYGGYYETAGGESLWLEDRISAAPAAVLTERLATRTTNPYGKDPAELAETLHYQQTVELLLRASATFEVVTTIPVTHVADLVLRHAGLPA